MIVSIGMADRNSTAFILADTLAERNAPVSFLGPFSQNKDSLELLEYVINQCILFDPVFCNTDGKVSDITEERLKTAFSVNLDIEIVCIEEECYLCKEVQKAVDNALKLVKAKLVVVKKGENVELLADKLVKMDKYEN